MISVIIPTYKRPEALERCLEALNSQFPAITDVEVLILDDGKDAEFGRRSIARFPWAQWHAGPGRGPAANRNRGATLACGTWLIFLDDDCIPSREYLASYRKVISEQSAGECLVLLGPTRRAKPAESMLWEAPHNPEGAVVISCNFAIKRAVFLESGGFDERFPLAAFEDTEFEARIRALNVEVLFVPDAAVEHPLRPVPNALQLARRWEARVISTMDLGATTAELWWRLPEHIFKVIVSRFRRQRWNWDMCRALVRFSGEFAWVIWLMPGWLRRHARGRRSAFWAEQMERGMVPARFGL